MTQEQFGIAYLNHICYNKYVKTRNSHDMAELPSEISAEIEAFFAPQFEPEQGDFVCVYGSSLYKGPEATSDVDLFVVSHDPAGISGDSLKRMATFIRDMHVRHGRKIDEEVPYENKIHYTEDELSDALCLMAFEETETGLGVPKVVKTAEFLNSSAIKARLFLNALTTPHAVVAPSQHRYVVAREGAEDAVTLLAASLCRTEEMTPQDLYERLTVGPDGEVGEMHLGYKVEHPMVADHLETVLDGGICRLVNRGVFEATDDGVRVDVSSFNPVASMYNSLNRV